MRTTPNFTLVIALAAAACSGSRQALPERVEPLGAGTGTLVVVVEGLRSADGTVNLSLFRSADGFPDDSNNVFRTETIVLPADLEEPVFEFTDLDYGVYALSMLHDANGNGAMDTGFLGVPLEGFGFSNNPPIGFGAPSFDACKFRFDGAEVTLRVLIRYL